MTNPSKGTPPTGRSLVTITHKAHSPAVPAPNRRRASGQGPQWHKLFSGARTPLLPAPRPRPIASVRVRLLALLLLLTLLLTALWAARPFAWPAPANAPPSNSLPEIGPAVPQDPTTTPVPDLGQLPLPFVPNAGQTNPAVRFQVHSLGGMFFFTPGEVVLSWQDIAPARAAPGGVPDPQAFLPQDGLQPVPAVPVPVAPPVVVRLRFEGANPALEVVGTERLPGLVNYFLGEDPTQWLTDLPTYAGIVYQQLYPGIDLGYDGTEGMLKGTYTVAPGADPGRIHWRYEGAARVRVDEQTGDLVIDVPASAGEGYSGRGLIERAPVAWQIIGGQRVPVSVRYVIAGDGHIEFALGSYDLSQPLTLDPTLIYSTYLGGAGNDFGYSIVVDASGNAYLTGYTNSMNFPTASPLQAVNAGIADVFVTKLNPGGSALVYSTYLGGGNDDFGQDIAVDASGNAYLTGYTYSTNFPTASPLQAANAGIADVFVTKLNPSGSALVYSTYLGGGNTDFTQDITVDTSGNAYLTGYTTSTNFPTASPLQAVNAGGLDAFVTKLNPSGSALVYSTYLGGSNTDLGLGIAFDALGAVYLTGYTASTSFPTASPLQAASAGGLDAFVTKLNPSGSALVYSTYLGGSGDDFGSGLVLDGSGNAYLTGYTSSTNFPTASPLQAASAGSTDVFATKLNPSGSALVYSTYLGGGNFDFGQDIVVAASGDAYLIGYTYSTNFPTLRPSQGSNAGGADVFVARLNPAGSALIYSTYLGGGSDDIGLGIALDASEDTYLTGYTSSTNFPTASPLQSTNMGAISAFVAKMADNVAPVVNAGADGTIPEGETFTSAGSFTDPDADTWTAAVDYGDGSGMQPLAFNPDKTFSLSHVYADNGSYTVTVAVMDDKGGVGGDTALVVVSNVAPVVNAGADGTIPEGGTFTSAGSFTDPGADSWTGTVDYGDGTGVQALGLNADKTFALSHVYVDNGTYTVTVVVTDDDGGSGSDTALVVVSNVAPVVNAGADGTIPEGGTFTSAGSFTDPGADSWTGTVDYGDGTGVQALGLNADKTFALSHLYSTAGVYTVTATVSDDDGGVGLDTAMVMVIGNTAPTVDAGPDATLDEGDTFSSSGLFTDPDAGTWTGTVDYGDGTGVQALGLNADKTFALSHVYADNGTYTVTVVVTDDDGGVGSDTALVVVSNVAPVVGPITVSAGAIIVGTPISVTAPFTDSGILDTHTAAWDWGDGTSSPGALTEAGGSGTVADSHVYTATGIYTITLTVTDDDGMAGIAQFPFVVVNESTGAFVTGGGWIDSPAGAYAANPTLTGRVNFGFNAKFLPGATTPSGVTQLHFKAAHLNFHSNTYTSLVITGARAQYQGTGTINGAGSYGFMVTVVDGDFNGGTDPDKFRIKIWDATGTVVYDSGLGAPDSADPTIELRGGSIVIHMP